MTSPTYAELASAAADLLAAIDASHTTHSSTDVHGHGGVAGQAITPHCHWQCNVVGAHDGTKAGLQHARTRLAHLLEQSGVEEKSSEIPPSWPRFRVQSIPPGRHVSNPVTAERALELITKYDDAYGEDGIDFHLQYEPSPRAAWVDLPDRCEGTLRAAVANQTATAYEHDA